LHRKFGATHTAVNAIHACFHTPLARRKEISAWGRIAFPSLSLISKASHLLLTTAVTRLPV
jgi:hypothetical protein